MWWVRDEEMKPLAQDEDETGELSKDDTSSQDGDDGQGEKSSAHC